MTKFEKGISNEIMGLILAGGNGTRLSPLTDETSKQLLPIGGKPMILRTINQLQQTGIKKLVVLLDHKYANKYMEIIKDGHDLGFEAVSYIWQSPKGLGLPTAILQSEAFVKPHKLVVACGDVLIEEGYTHAVQHFSYQTRGARIIGMSEADTAGYSPLITCGEAVKKILPKDKNRHQSGVIDLGVYMYQPDVFDIIKTLKPSARGETEINDLNNLYAKGNNLWHSRVWGYWSDTGSSLETYRRANEYYQGK